MAHLNLPYNPKKNGKKASHFESRLHPMRGRRCPYGMLPGQCLNGQCPSRMHGEIMYRRPEIEKEALLQRQQLEAALERQKRMEINLFLEDERRTLGFKSSDDGADQFLEQRPSQEYQKYLSAKKPVKSMRLPARPVCMLEVPKYTPPSGDYAELSSFLRLSTMPGYSDNDNNVSEYRGTHNMEVWDGQKDLNRQAYKMKRDWLSVWGEFNVKEQRWRKAWVEKFGAEKN